MNRDRDVDPVADAIADAVVTTALSTLHDGLRLVTGATGTFSAQCVAMNMSDGQLHLYLCDWPRAHHALGPVACVRLTLVAELVWRADGTESAEEVAGDE